MTSSNKKVNLYLRICCVLTTFGPIGPKKFYQAINPKYQPQFSQTRPHFILNLELNRMISSNVKINFYLWAFHLKTSFGPIEHKRVFQKVSFSSQFQFSQTRPHFIQNKEVNSMNLSNFKIDFHLEVWDLKTKFTPIGARRVTLISLLTNTALFYSESKGEPDTLLKRQNKPCWPSGPNCKNQLWDSSA